MMASNNTYETSDLFTFRHSDGGRNPSELSIDTGRSILSTSKGRCDE